MQNRVNVALIIFLALWGGQKNVYTAQVVPPVPKTSASVVSVQQVSATTQYNKPVQHTLNNKTQTATPKMTQPISHPKITVPTKYTFNTPNISNDSQIDSNAQISETPNLNNMYTPKNVMVIDGVDSTIQNTKQIQNKSQSGNQKAVTDFQVEDKKTKLPMSTNNHVRSIKTESKTEHNSSIQDKSVTTIHQNLNSLDVSQQNKLQTQVLESEKKNTDIGNNIDYISPDKADEIAQIRDNARVLYNAGKNEDSKAEFSKISDAQKSADDWLLMGNIAIDENKPIDAVFFFKKAIQVDDNNYKAHFNLGNLYLSDGKINSALNEYRKVLRINKNYSYAHYNKGCCYLKSKNYFNARYEFGLAIRSNPNEPAFYYNLAYTNKMMGKTKKAQEALDMYNQLMRE